MRYKTEGYLGLDFKDFFISPMFCRHKGQIEEAKLHSTWAKEFQHCGKMSFLFLNFSLSILIIKGTREITQWIQYLMHRHGSMSLDPQHLTVMHFYLSIPHIHLNFGLHQETMADKREMISGP